VERENAIVVRYWVATDHRPFPDLEGIEDFRKELAEAYVSIIDGRPAGAGGLTSFHVELLSTLSLRHLVQLVLDGVAFDLVKQGAEAFVLRPFLHAYRRLRERNQARIVDIGDLQIRFQDSLVVLHEIKSNTLLSYLDRIFWTLAHSYGRLLLENGDSPSEIHIPVFEDSRPDGACRFRILSRFDDETIRPKGAEEYVGFWGLMYDFGSRRVFDVNGASVLSEHWHTLREHWDEHRSSYSQGR
jgi:hypothetical protein